MVLIFTTQLLFLTELMCFCVYDYFDQLVQKWYAEAIIKGYFIR
ncbi:hypothetical protein PT7_2283 [Pusillimonas sp. T7-7]|nr:hypothetical protein PT7_2283 [Pusillimonas sp. T7-7]